MQLTQNESVLYNISYLVKIDPSVKKSLASLCADCVEDFFFSDSETVGSCLFISNDSPCGLSTLCPVCLLSCKWTPPFLQSPWN